MTASVYSRPAKMASEYRLDDVYVFGSRATEIAMLVAGAEPLVAPPDSDVDVGIQPARGFRPTARERVRLTLQLEELLGVPRVDLVILPEANAFLAPRSSEASCCLRGTWTRRPKPNEARVNADR